MYEEAFTSGIADDAIDAEYFEGYGDVEVHRTMITDAPRMQSYDAGMAHVKGKVVVDVGAGTGVLSLMAARAGAAHVYAVEASSMAGLLPGIFDKNGYAARITVVPKRVEDVTVADLGGKPADIILSEWMGFYLLHESMLPSVVHARDHLLPAGQKVEPWQMIPCQADIYVAPTNMRRHIDDRVNVWKNVSGFDLSDISEPAFAALVQEPLVDCIDPALLTGTPQTVVSYDLTTVALTDLIEHTSTHTFKTSQPTSAVNIWFDVKLNETTTLSTSPQAPPTHWKQTTVFLPSDPLPAGDVSFEVSFARAENFRCYSMSIQLLEGSSAKQMLLDALMAQS
ncbi:Protein arginine N-methyltransferase 1 [Diplonema papillatum]|nr:Protein arginine N-methyltransferase 1 [Diplonema papillatum]